MTCFKWCNNPCKIFTEISPRLARSRQDWRDLAEISLWVCQSQRDHEIPYVSPRLAKSHWDWRNHAEIAEISPILQRPRSLFTRPISPSDIYGTFLLPLILPMSQQKGNNTSWYCHLIAWNSGLYGAVECLQICQKCDFAKSRFYFVHRTCTKNYLSMKLISQKLIEWPYLLSQKKYSAAKAECNCAKLYKRLQGGIFPILKSPFYAKSTLQNFF